MSAEPGIPAATYISAAIAPDSIDHFVVLMTSSELRPVAAPAIAMACVIENIPRQAHEPQIAQLKLHWWLEEIEMIAGDKPRHPLSIELTDRLKTRSWLEPLHALVSGVLRDAGRPVFRSLHELLPFCHQAAERQALIAAVLPECDAQALSRARRLGVGVCLTETIHDWRSRVGRLPEAGLDGQGAAATATQLADIADQHFDVCEPMPVGQRRAQRSVLLQARLYHRLLNRLRASDYDADRAAMRPITLMWHAWNEARNLNK
jgi:phytoene synthase